MRTRHIFSFLLALCLLTLGTGCATKALWESGDLEAWKQPAANPHLQLFAAKQPNDILVIYDEYSERNDTTQTRAYWLNQNQKLIEQRHAPHFVGADNSAAYTVVPVISADTNQITLLPPYAVVATNGQSFALHSPQGAVESHDLPFYNDGKGKVEKFALTPLATTADITILGGVLGYFYLQGLASSGAGYSWKP